MKLTLSIDDRIVARARTRAEARGKSLDQVIHEYLEHLAGSAEPEGAIREFEQLSGRGDSRGWRFDRDESHERS